MEATTAHDHGHHHALPTRRAALTGLAIDATLHCLTGCAIGEIAGMAIGTAAGFSNGATVALSIVLAFVFGYGLTSLPLLRAGLPVRRWPGSPSPPTRSASRRWRSSTTRSCVAFPGAIDAGLDTLLFWGSLAFSLAVAGALTVPVNRWLLARGKGHAAVHETGIHGGPPVNVVGASPRSPSSSAPRC